jgi:hypothetical protein
VLRRRSEADAFAKALEVEAEVVKLLPGLRQSKHVKEWAQKKYGKNDEEHTR